MRYRATREAVHIEQGVFFKQQRQARLDRVQSIDVAQPLLARIFGLAQLKFEVAGGKDSRVVLSYLSLSVAEELRASLLAGAAGIDVEEGAAAPRAPENELLSVSPLKILGAQFLTFWGIILPAVVLALIVITIVTGEPAILTSVIPVGIGAAAAIWKRFATESNFSIAASPDGIRIRSGLLETNAQTVPPGRIQAIGFSQPFLWRLPGWWRVSVNLASLSDQQGMARGVLLPVGSRADLMAVMSLALPEPGVDDAGALVTALMSGRRDDGDMVPVPLRARWLDPLSYTRTAYFVTETAVAVRTGRINRAATWVPHAKTQSLHLRQGPAQRSFTLATVTFDTTSGPVSPVIKHLATDVATAFIDAQAERARGARGTAGPEQWMRRRTAGGTT
nr:PH domain-containing protein [Spelaeicoccus albus]